MHLSQLIVQLGFVSLTAACSVYVCSDPDLKTYCSCLNKEIMSCTDSVFDKVARETLEDAWATVKCDASTYLLSLPLLLATTAISLLTR